LQGQVTRKSKSLGSHHLNEKFNFPIFALCLPNLSWSSCYIIIWLFFELVFAKIFDPLLDIAFDDVLATGCTTAGGIVTVAGKEGIAGRIGRLFLTTFFFFVIFAFLVVWVWSWLVLLTLFIALNLRSALTT
jgi:hypothetical protein